MPPMKVNGPVCDAAGLFVIMGVNQPLTLAGWPPGSVSGFGARPRGSGVGSRPPCAGRFAHR